MKSWFFAEVLYVIVSTEFGDWSWSLSNVFVACSDSHLPKAPDEVEAKVIDMIYEYDFAAWPMLEASVTVYKEIQVPPKRRYFPLPLS